MAMSFDGATTLEATTAVVTSEPCTLAAWCKPNSVHDAYALMIGHSSDTGRLGIFLRSSGKVAAVKKGSGGSVSVDTTTSYGAGAWQHIASVFTSSSSRAAYLNGGGKGTDTTSLGSSTVDRTRLASRPPNDLFLDGELAEAAIWNAALDDEEIALLAAGLSPLLLSRRLGNLVLYQDLIRGANRPGIGPLLTPSGTTSTTPHVRICYRGIGQGRRHFPGFQEPYILAFGQTQASTAEVGQLALPGVAAGMTYPYGEVAS